MRRLLLGLLPLLLAGLPARYLVQDASSRAFGHPLPGLPEEALEAFRLGDQAFQRVGVRKDGQSPHPFFGLQLQNHALPGHTPEGRMELHWEEVEGCYPDGTPYRLRGCRKRVV